MEEIVIPIVSMTTTFGTMFAIPYVYWKIRNKERMALIEKGVDPELIFRKSEKTGKFVALLLGMVSIGAALGIVAGNICTYQLQMIEGLAFGSMVPLFVGLSLLSYYFFVGKLEKKINK
jgi:hypothetical protein